jgi:predicted ArsR family transcriptional regulator
MGIITDILKELPLNAVLRDKLQDLERKYGALEVENAKLKEENQELKTKLKELTITGKLSEPEVKILLLLSSSNRELTAEMIASELGLNLTKTKYYLERMYKKYVYSHDYSSGRPSEYYLIQKGREYLIENNLIE